MKRKPKVKLETEYVYTNKFSGKRIKFSPKSDEIVATLKPKIDEEKIKEIIVREKRDISQGFDLERGFAVFRVAEDEDPEKVATSLGARSEVINTIRVMRDDQGLTRYFMPDEICIQFKEGVSKAQAEKIIEENQSHILAEQRTPGYYTVAVPEGKGLFQILRKFSGLKEIAFAEPSEVGFDDALAYYPDDPDFRNLWGLHNTGQIIRGTPGEPGADISAVDAWDITLGDPCVIVVVVDTGADMNHPDLQENILPQQEEDWDFAVRWDTIPADVTGHGTHVAGTAVGAANSVGIIGVAPKCRCMPLRVNLISGMYQDRADAINYVASQAVSNTDLRYVMNLSWEMNGDHSGVHHALKNAVNANVVVVCAAGNKNRDLDVRARYPVEYPEVIAVAATDQKDRKAFFSNYGSRIDVSAPGMNILSTFPDDRYAYLAGTSMAAPHVAGVAALVWSRNPRLTNTQVRKIVEDSCDDIDALNPSYCKKLGNGRINAFKALESTPPPSMFQILRKFPFPEKNRGSSSALCMSRRMRLQNMYSTVLFFLTQQPCSEKIYYLDPATGEVLDSIDPVENDTIGSLAWYRGNILVANVATGSGSINRINPRTGEQRGSIQAPPGRGEGLAFDGTYVYYSTVTRIHVIHPRTGDIIRSFPPPGGDCRALCYGEGYLFSGNSSEGKITVFDRYTLAVHSEIEAPGEGSARVEGLAFDRVTNELFVANQSENTIYVGKVRL